jgi:hypothetical protein
MWKANKLKPTLAVERALADPGSAAMFSLAACTWGADAIPKWDLLLSNSIHNTPRSIVLSAWDPPLPYHVIN